MGGADDYCKSKLNEIGYKIRNWNRIEICLPNSHTRHKLDISKLDLLQIRNQIFQATVAAENVLQGQLLELVDRIHHTNCYLRHLGIFKAKSKKSWKLDKKRLEYIIAMQDAAQKETVSEANSGSKAEPDFLEIAEELSAAEYAEEEIFFDDLVQ